MNKKVKNIVDRIFPISKESFQKIDHLLSFETLEKGEIFIRRNKRNEKEYFVLQKSFTPEMEKRKALENIYCGLDIMNLFTQDNSFRI